jgi:hypothetical protein
MIIIDQASNYNFTFGIGQTQDFIINFLESRFIEKHGQNLYNKCSLILIIENENFYHVIRNKHKIRVSGELMSNLLNDLSSHF